MFNHCFGEHELVRLSNRKHKFVRGACEGKEVVDWKARNLAKYWPKAVSEVEDRKYLWRLSSRLSGAYCIHPRLV